MVCDCICTLTAYWLWQVLFSKSYLCQSQWQLIWAALCHFKQQTSNISHKAKSPQSMDHEWRRCLGPPQVNCVWKTLLFFFLSTVLFIQIKDEVQLMVGFSTACQKHVSVSQCFDAEVICPLITTETSSVTVSTVFSSFAQWVFQVKLDSKLQHLCL